MTTVLETTEPRRTGAAGGTRRVRRSRSGGRRTRAGFTPYLFLAPGFALFLLVIIYPMLRAFQMSF